MMQVEEYLDCSQNSNKRPKLLNLILSSEYNVQIIFKKYLWWGGGVISIFRGIYDYTHINQKVVFIKFNLAGIKYCCYI